MPHYFADLQRDHDLENYPCVGAGIWGSKTLHRFAFKESGLFKALEADVPDSRDEIPVISVAHQPDIPLQPVATLSRADIIIAVIMTIIVHGVAPETILPARRPSQSEVLRFSSSFTPAETVSGLGLRIRK